MVKKFFLLTAFFGCLSLWTIPSAGGNAEMLPIPKGSYAKWGAGKGPIPKKILNNPGIVGIVIGQPWNLVEPQEGDYDWSKLDARIKEAGQAGIKVVLSIITSLQYAPLWITNNPDVKTIEMIDLGLFSPSHCESMKTPVYWDPYYQAKKLELIREAGKRYSSNPTVAGVLCGVANYTWNEMKVPHAVRRAAICNGVRVNQVKQWRDAGYSHETMVQIGNETLDAYAAAFSHQMLQIEIHQTASKLDGTPAALAESFIRHASQQNYQNRFYVGIAFLSANSDMADDPSVNEATPQKFNYLLKILKANSPQIGVEMLTAASLGKKDGCRQNMRERPCPPYDVLKKSIDIGLSYHPYFINYWTEDSANPQLKDLIQNATVQMGGEPRNIH